MSSDLTRAVLSVDEIEAIRLAVAVNSFDSLDVEALLGSREALRAQLPRSSAVTDPTADIERERAIQRRLGDWQAVRASLTGDEDDDEWSEAEVALEAHAASDIGYLLTQLAAARSLVREPGIARIAAERERQIAVEGWAPEHDDQHGRGEMAITAACYAAFSTDAQVLVDGKDAFPWGSCDDKRLRHGRIKQLAIAGALIAAEIDRLSRALPAAPAAPTPATPAENER